MRVYWCAVYGLIYTLCCIKTLPSNKIEMPYTTREGPPWWLGQKGGKKQMQQGPHSGCPPQATHFTDHVWSENTARWTKLCLNYGYILSNFIHHIFCISIYVSMYLFGQLLTSHCVPEKIWDKLPKYMLQNINRRHLRVKEAKSKVHTQKYIPELLKMGQKLIFRLLTN